MTNKLSAYGGRMIETDGRATVELVSANDNNRDRHQYRRTPDGGIEKRHLNRDGAPMSDGSPWRPLSINDLISARGVWHPILDPLGL